MADSLKEKLTEKVAQFMRSDKVEKLMESEQFGVVMEKAMAIPFKFTNIAMSGKERLVALLDLATREDIDEVKRAMARLEGNLKDDDTESD
jgi:hypothetical protein